MSITNLFYKIKHYIEPEDGNKVNVIGVFIVFGGIVIASFTGFFLGRYSILSTMSDSSTTNKNGIKIPVNRSNSKDGSLAYALGAIQATSSGPLDAKTGISSNSPILADPEEDLGQNADLLAVEASHLNTNRYVASKNGRVYYFTWCSGAKRILEDNRQYFSTAKDARAAGLTPSKTCEGLD